ncbi:hypothetical protein C8Q70DRAFT_1036514 [Cubamyces menziesii]|nr:hypothetical protein C8Q70DRAFT_1036514 [Cubamyces menziesii]
MPPTRPTSFRLPRVGVPLRPRDLVTPQVPRTPRMPAELFTAAVLDEDQLGCGTLRRDDDFFNLKIILRVEEVPGTVEGIFQDPSTFHLYLKVEPLRYMRIVDVKLASFTGGEHERDAPTWLKSLRALDASSVSATRSYNWLYKFCCKLFCSPGTTVSKLSAWVTIMNTVNRMKREEDIVEWRRAGLARRGGVVGPPVCPRPLRTVADVTQRMEALVLDEFRSQAGLE